MRVLVTGADGFVGKHLLPILVAEGFDVVGIVRKPMPAVSLPSSGAGTLRMEVCDLTHGLKLIEPDDIIVHTATTHPADHSPTGDAFHTYINTVTTCRLIDDALSRGVRKFIFLSSILTFGEVETPVVDENTPIRNPGIYGISKYFSEKALEEVAEKLSSISLRIPGIIGLGAHRVWLPRCVEKMLNNEPVTIFNPAASFNNAVHIEDLSRFIVTLVNHSLNGHEVVTLGAKGMTSISGAMETLVSSLNSRSEIIEAESEQTTFTISIEKARKHFGYAPMDIEKMLKYYARETLDAISQETSELA